LKNVGDKVSIDDVIVIVETDKVTVDIKSSHSGVLVKQLATEIVNVGNPLYEIETEGENFEKNIEQTLSTKNEAKDVFITNTSVEDNKTRKASIKFVGKRQPHENKNENNITAIQSTALATTLLSTAFQATIKNAQQQQIKPVKTSTQTGVDFTTLKGGAWYGRIKLSPQEIEAVESGGATVIN
jgi:pyruvate/2-oxoglutarate dehydrogenase complex dihydrolipoamide acyltransferase (E2) component